MRQFKSIYPSRDRQGAEIACPLMDALNISAP